MSDLGYVIDGTDTSSAATVGTLAAQAVIGLPPRRRGNQFGGYADTTGYQPVNTPDKILDADRRQPLRVPTPPPCATECTGTIERFLTPHWRDVTPFARDANTLDEDARLYFALNNALLDASITAWDGKRNWTRSGRSPPCGGCCGARSSRPGVAPTRVPPTSRVRSRVHQRPFHLQHGRRRGPDRLLRPGNFEMTVTVAAGSSRVEPGAVLAKPITSSGPTSATPPNKPASHGSTAGSTSRTATTTPARPAPRSASGPGPSP